MNKNILKCKLEDFVASIGQEVNSKFKEELDPLYKLIHTMIITSFFSFCIIISLIFYIIMTEYHYEEKIIYIDKGEIYELHRN